MGKARRFIETAGVYFIGNVLSKLVALFLLPLYTSKILPDKFGEYDLVFTMLSLFVPVIFFQIWDGMFRFAFEKEGIKDKYRVISNSTTVCFFGGIIYSIAFFIIYKILHFELALLIFIYGISFALQYQYTFIARIFLRNKLFVVSGLVNSLLSALLNIVLILRFGLGYESLYIAPVIGCIAQILIIEIVLHPSAHFHFKHIERYLIGDMLKFSIPLCIATVSYWLLGGFTKVVISQKLGIYENGLYAVANRFSSVVTLVVGVFQYSWNEMAYMMIKDDNRVIIYEKGIHLMFKAVILGSGILLIVIKLIFPYLIDQSYIKALELVPLTLLGIAANSLASFVSTIFMTEKQTQYILRTTGIGAILNLVCVWFITPVLGIQGAIGALCLSFIIIAILRLYLLKSIINFRISVTYILYIPIIIVVIFLFFSISNVLILNLILLLLLGFTGYSLRDVMMGILKSIARGNRI